MKKIILTRGFCALVNNKDFPSLAKFKWFAVGPGRSGEFRAARNVYTPKHTLIYMHSVIMGCPGNKKVDHKNGDTLDNRKGNLRVCLHHQNIWNQGIRRNNTSGHKGVCWNTTRNAWSARIGVHPKRIFLGYFQSKEMAGCAYKKAAIKYHGEFSRI